MVYTNPLCLLHTLQNGCIKISVGISNLLNIEVDTESIDILIIMIIHIQELSVILHLSQFLCLSIKLHTLSIKAYNIVLDLFLVILYFSCH